MRADCHMHMILDGVDWKSAIARHKEKPDEAFIRQVLQAYKDLGYQIGDFPVAEQNAREELSLPMYYGMTDAQVSHVIDVLNRFE